MDFFKCPKCDRPTKFPWPSTHTCGCSFWVPSDTPGQSFNPRDEEDMKAYRKAYNQQVGKYWNDA